MREPSFSYPQAVDKPGLLRNSNRDNGRHGHPRARGHPRRRPDHPTRAQRTTAIHQQLDRTHQRRTRARPHLGMGLPPRATRVARTAYLAGSPKLSDTCWVPHPHPRGGRPRHSGRSYAQRTSAGPLGLRASHYLPLAPNYARDVASLATYCTRYQLDAPSYVLVQIALPQLALRSWSPASSSEL